MKRQAAALRLALGVYTRGKLPRCGSRWACIMLLAGEQRWACSIFFPCSSVRCGASLGGSSGGRRLIRWLGGESGCAGDMSSGKWSSCCELLSSGKLASCGELELASRGECDGELASGGSSGAEVAGSEGKSVGGGASTMMNSCAVAPLASCLSDASTHAKLWLGADLSGASTSSSENSDGAGGETGDGAGGGKGGGAEVANAVQP